MHEYLVPALPEGIRNVNMKSTQRLGAYYAKQKYLVTLVDQVHPTAVAGICEVGNPKWE